MENARYIRRCFLLGDLDLINDRYMSDHKLRGRALNLGLQDSDIVVSWTAASSLAVCP